MRSLRENFSEDSSRNSSGYASGARGRATPEVSRTIDRVALENARRKQRAPVDKRVNEVKQSPFSLTSRKVSANSSSGSGSDA